MVLKPFRTGPIRTGWGKLGAGRSAWVGAAELGESGCGALCTTEKWTRRTQRHRKACTGPIQPGLPHRDAVLKGEVVGLHAALSSLDGRQDKPAFHESFKVMQYIFFPFLCSSSFGGLSKCRGALGQIFTLPTGRRGGCFWRSGCSSLSGYSGRLT